MESGLSASWITMYVLVGLVALSGVARRLAERSVTMPKVTTAVVGGLPRLSVDMSVSEVGWWGYLHSAAILRLFGNARLFSVLHWTLLLTGLVFIVSFMVVEVWENQFEANVLFSGGSFVFWKTWDVTIFALSFLVGHLTVGVIDRRLRSFVCPEKNAVWIFFFVLTVGCLVRLLDKDMIGVVVCIALLSVTSLAVLNITIFGDVWRDLKRIAWHARRGDGEKINLW